MLTYMDNRQDMSDVQYHINPQQLEIDISCTAVLLSFSCLALLALGRKVISSDVSSVNEVLESEQQPIIQPSDSFNYGTLPSTRNIIISTSTAYSDWKWLHRISFFRLLLLFPLYFFSRGFPYYSLVQLLVWSYVILLTKFDTSYVYHLRWMYLTQFSIHAYQLHESYSSPMVWLSLVIIGVEFSLAFISFLIPQSWDTSKNYEQNASMLSRLTFHYIQPILNLGEDISTEKLFPLNLDENPQHLHDMKSQLLTDTNEISIKRIFLLFKFDFLFQFMFALASLTFGLCVPVLLNQFLTLLNQPLNNDQSNGVSLWDQPIFILILLLVSGTLKSLAESESFFLGRKISIRVKSLILSLVTERTLKLPIPDSGEGVVTNLLSVDSHGIGEAWCYLHFLYAMPIGLMFCLGYLGVILGVLPMLAAILVTALTLPINHYISSNWKRIQGNLMEHSDARMTITQQLLGAWRTLRMFGWQTIYQEKIQKARREELITLKSRLSCWILGTALWSTFPLALSLVTFLTYTKLLNKQLTPEVTFTSLLIFKTLKEPVDILPLVINMWIQARVALTRVNNFLAVTNIDKSNSKLVKNHMEGSIKLDGCTFGWNDLFQIKNVTLTIPNNQLTLIMGPTGSGKSSLLLGMLGEMPLIGGNMELDSLSHSSHPVISYVAQTPWLKAETIRDNILFGEPFQAIRYKKVLEACGLVPDLHLMPQADLTMLGSDGLTLSGGQRQRVALARAIYSSSRIVLLDDCLSAVDPKTMNDLWRLLLGGGDLVKERAIVLITHHCPPTKFSWKGLLINVDSKQLVTANLVSSTTDITDKLPTPDIINNNNIKDEDSKISEEQDEEDKEEQEGMSSGSVSKSVYWRYFSVSGGYFYWLKLMILLLAYQGAIVGGDYWLKLWSSSTSTNNTDYYLIIYLALGVLSLLLISYRVSYQFLGSLSASESIHENMLQGIVNASHSFLEATPVGRITNRFSRDLQCIDQELINGLGILIMECLMAITTLLLIFISLPYPLITLLMLSGVIYVGYTVILLPYISSSRQLKRIESVTRSPIYTHAANLSSGCITLRAYQRENASMLTTYNLIEHNLKAFFLLWSTNRWLQIRSDALGNLISFSTGLLLLVAIKYKMVDSSTGGLIMCYALNLASHILWITRYYAVVEMNMNSMERVMEYESLFSEESRKNDNHSVEQDWPKNGSIDLNKLTVHHNPQKPPALANLSVAINSGDKIGVVGRTGAGKSTLAQALLALTPSPSSGSIAINQVNLYSPEFNLKQLHHQLRTNITMIPQDPTELINCRLKLRDWLDPETRWPDYQLIDALNLVGLPLPGAGLDEVLTRVSYSMGQLQLIALARAVIRKSKIVIMDEATASVDHDTDDRLQKLLLGGELLDKECTLICIAHRLNTVMGYDKILVLDKGHIVECGTPESLLKLESGHFKKMTKDMNQQIIFK